MKYALETNILIDGFRNEEAQAEIFAFFNRALPFTYLSAVVMQELAAGARTPRAAREDSGGRLHTERSGSPRELIAHPVEAVLDAKSLLGIGSYGILDSGSEVLMVFHRGL